MNSLVSPINLVIRCIKHLVACGARGTLIVLKWTSAAFCHFYFDKNLKYRSNVMDVIKIIDTACIYEHGSNKNSIFCIEPFLTPVMAVLPDAKFIDMTLVSDL